MKPFVTWLFFNFVSVYIYTNKIDNLRLIRLATSFFKNAFSKCHVINLSNFRNILQEIMFFKNLARKNQFNHGLELKYSTRQ